MGLGIGHRTAVELLKRRISRGATVIDAGAFPGNLTRELALHWRVVALDTEPARKLHAGIRYKLGQEEVSEPTFAEAMAAIGVDTLKVDIEVDRWPIDSTSVDAVVLTEVIEHLYTNPIHALLEANRVLRSGGVLFLSTPNLLSIRSRANFALGRMDRVIQPPFLAFLQKIRLGHNGHIRIYAPAELKGMLHATGFSSEIHFASFDFWEGASADTTGNVGTVPRPRIARVFKSPRNYVRALLATIEKCVSE